MPHEFAERNLLTGFLALQMCFIERGQFLAAISDWLTDKSRSLSDILVAQKALTPELQTLLDTLVDKHLDLHGNDPAQSLATLHAIEDDVVRDLQSLTDVDLERSLHTVVRGPQAQPLPLSTPPGQPQSLPTPASRSQAQSQAQATPQPLSQTIPLSQPPAGLDTRAFAPQDRSQNSGSRFRVLRPCAQGGLGEVLVARDEEVPREVALKRILQRHADNPQSRARFLLEAEITGGLEHPGIVPVYGLGTSLDGRPYYAMRLIRGDSLKEALDRFHQPPAEATEAPVSARLGSSARLDSSARLGLEAPARAHEFRQLLGRFVDVCQAIAYAHSRGVLHRDLKPGNIMLGKYGETLVVDWGLAKLCGPAQATEETRVLVSEGPLHALLESGSAPTMAGEFVGTPAFASPEQAQGRLDLLGPASDIYSLGGILYAILTGRPPHQGQDLHELLRRLNQGDLLRPRSLVADVPPALEAICLKALSLNPAARYASAEALADEVERYLGDEPVSAYPEPWSVRLRRVARKRPSLAAGLAATIFVGLLASGISSLLLGFKNEQLAEANVDLQVARDSAQANEQKALESSRVAESRRLDAEREKQEAQRQTKLAEQQQQEAQRQKRFAEQQKFEAEVQRTLAVDSKQKAQQEQERAEKAFEFLVRAFRRPDPALNGRQLKVADLLEQSERELSWSKFDLETKAALLAAIQETYEGLGILDRELATAVQVFKWYLALLGPDDDRTLKAQCAVAQALDHHGKRDHAEALLLSIRAKAEAKHGLRHELTLRALTNLAQVYDDQDQFTKSIPLREIVVNEQKSLLGPLDRTTLWSQVRLATTYIQEPKTLSKGLDLLQATHESMGQALGLDHPTTLACKLQWARALGSADKGSLAAPMYRECYAKMTTVLGPNNPQTLRAMSYIAEDLRRHGGAKEAAPMFRECMDRMEAALGPQSRATLQCMEEYASCLAQLDELDEAISLFDLVVKRSQALPDPIPGENISVRVNYGQILTKAEAYPEAETELLAAIQELDDLKWTHSLYYGRCLSALVALYTAWNKPAEAARWKARIPSPKK